ncbi:hypothetical protein BUALT_Bualt16G0022800 [Buddleja alternifolia]|uniref:Transcription initiation factor TFIID subunit 8 n=1 Tax=Buddleja alternifolia TaxID=168488 RepID=A0AAV6WHR6_9LAMI|nr:hypothetical protein BUALT_Bualt16G0022800 [Buddleja alternifolia]
MSTPKVKVALADHSDRNRLPKADFRSCAVLAVYKVAALVPPLLPPFRFFFDLAQLNPKSQGFCLNVVGMMINGEISVLAGLNDGDGKDSVKFSIERENRHSKRLGFDEFAQAIARIAVAQICEGLGFQSFQQSALDSLADVGVRYIREIGKVASSYANLGNRSECNVFDVIQGLEVLNSVQGFSGFSDVAHSLSGSGVVRDIVRYVGKAEEIPFAYLIPDFPVVKERKLNPSFAETGESPPDDHIPSWLPKYPNPETYLNLDSKNEKEVKITVDKEVQEVENQREVERPLMNLQQKLICNGSELGFEQRAAESNPFLAPPLRPEEKEVSLPILSFKLLDEAVGHHQNHVIDENHVSRANEVATNGTCEDEDKCKILSNGRPNIHFKFRNGKKNLGRMETSPRVECIEKLSLWFGDGYDGKDEKKRILWQNMEYPPELPHL